MLNYILDQSILRNITIATYIDLSKAYLLFTVYCLQYDKLFTKLESLGIKRTELNWFKDYLSNRRQCVDLEGTTSDWIDVKLGSTSGVNIGAHSLSNLC